MQSRHEEEFSALKTRIRQFELEYEQALGRRISELEDLEWQLQGLLQTEESGRVEGIGQEQVFSQFNHRTDLLDEDPGAAADEPQKPLKYLYREVAKAIHPDLSADDEERLRRQELMTVANQAYQAGDRRMLEELLADWEQGPEAISGADVAMELVRVIRQIARAEQDIHALIRQIEELKGTDIYQFKLRVDEAMADGIDLMAEMAATVDLDIAKARKRLSALQGCPSSEEAGDGLPLETRLIRFPNEVSCGTLYERNSASVDYRDWQKLGAARGVREVFLDKSIRLDVKGTSETEINFLDQLQPNDLQALFLYEIEDAALAHLRGLTGLQELYLSNTRVSDEGLGQLLALGQLRRLYIYHTPITDLALEQLARLRGLQWLTCSGTRITQEGLNRFRQAMPGCKAVSFEWRHGK